MLNGQVYDVNSVNLGPYNSSTKPYLHFVDYANLNYITCAVADGRSAYYQYKWWCVAGLMRHTCMGAVLYQPLGQPAWEVLICTMPQSHHGWPQSHRG